MIQAASDEVTSRPVQYPRMAEADRIAEFKEVAELMPDNPSCGSASPGRTSTRSSPRSIGRCFHEESNPRAVVGLALAAASVAELTDDAVEPLALPQPAWSNRRAHGPHTGLSPARPTERRCCQRQLALSRHPSRKAPRRARGDLFGFLDASRSAVCGAVRECRSEAYCLTNVRPQARGQAGVCTRRPVPREPSKRAAT